MKKFDKYSKWILRISIIGSLAHTLPANHWVGTSGGSLVLIATFIVDFINRKYKRINPTITTYVYFYCIFSLVLGNMWDFYDIIWWWDIVMHILSGIILGLIGNILFNGINKKNFNSKIKFLFIVGIACIGGIIWEIFEFFIDLLLNLDTQLSLSTGVSDTMWDLITDLLGGIIIGLILTIK